MLPVHHSFVIPVKRTALGLLAAPTETVHQTPYAGGFVAHPKEIPDQMRDPVKGPVVFGVALPIGSPAPRSGANAGIERAIYDRGAPAHADCAWVGASDVAIAAHSVQ